MYFNEYDLSVLALQKNSMDIDLLWLCLKKYFPPQTYFWVCLYVCFFCASNYDSVLFFSLSPAAEIRPRFFSACYIWAPSSGQKESGTVVAPVKRGSVKSDLFLVRFYVCHAVDTKKLDPFFTTSGIIYASWQIHLTKALDAVSINQERVFAQKVKEAHVEVMSLHPVYLTPNGSGTYWHRTVCAQLRSRQRNLTKT